MLKTIAIIYFAHKTEVWEGLNGDSWSELHGAPAGAECQGVEDPL
jgi:hypothetical protein